MKYPETELFIAGRWRGGGLPDLEVINPATSEIAGTVACANHADLDEALAAADGGFRNWRRVGALEKSFILRRAATLLRERKESIAYVMTVEQGKPLNEARAEITGAADTIEWFAEESRRSYGRVIPSRHHDVSQFVVKEPVGPVAAFTPWNFPLNQAVRKVSAALAAGCSVILKGPEETPASCAALIGVFADAGLPIGVVNLVFGVPSQISSYLIAHPTIQKISFTGSTAVGKQLASLAGAHMKRVTMELGGHAPAIVFDDADIDSAVRILSGAKFRNAGQVCVAPTRFLVHEAVFDRFVDGLVDTSDRIEVGNGLDEKTTMGPLANGRRAEAMEALTSDAVALGAIVRTGAERIGNRGYFYKPTVLTDVPKEARMMKEEPFGPVAIVNRFSTYEEAISQANRLPYGLAAYVYTASARTMAQAGRDIQSGMVSINHHGLGLPELPFGGIKDSGYGSEGGVEAMESYLNSKIITQAV
jgi:succinate-semialdehyde dehydrogenase / glutarate-semialdehyde dehydrogenase